MKPLNKAERWYLYLWMFITADYESFQRVGYTGELMAAGREISDVKRHRELQKYGAYLRHETHE